MLKSGPKWAQHIYTNLQHQAPPLESLTPLLASSDFVLVPPTRDEEEEARGNIRPKVSFLKPMSVKFDIWYTSS